MQSRSLWIAIFLFLVLFCACNSSVQPTVEIKVDQTTIFVGEETGLSVSVLADQDVQFEWSTTAGTLSSSSSQSVIFIAPDNPGTVIVDLKITSGNQIATDSITFEVIPLEVVEVSTPTPTRTIEPSPTTTPLPKPNTPTPTNTPAPTLTPTPTRIPSAISCDNRAVAPNIFKQLADQLEFSFADAQNSDNFECEAVYDRVNTQDPFELAIKLDFNADDNEFAFFGMSISEGYDVSNFDSFCFWVFSEEPNQVFEVQMKDTQQVIAVYQVIHEVPNVWTLYCEKFEQFSLNGSSDLNLQSILDFSIGFNEGSGSALIWLDDFELKSGG